MMARYLLNTSLLALLLAACSDPATIVNVVDGDVGSGSGDASGDTGGSDVADTGDATSDVLGADDADAASDDGDSGGDDADDAANDVNDVNDDASTDASDDTSIDTGNDASTDADPDVNTDTGEDASTDTGTDTAPDAGTDTTPDAADDTSPDTSTDVVEFVCGEDVVFTGQVFRAEDEPADSPNGGIPSFTPYAPSYDAGVATLIAAGLDQVEPVAVDIAVRDATIVATSFNNDAALRAQSNFWIADANGTIEVRLDFSSPDNLPAFPILVGQRISFDATELGWFGDFPQVAAAENFTLVSEDNPVYLYEPGTAALTLDDAPGVVRVTGTLTADLGACGGTSTCYALEYGAASPVTLRSSSTFLAVGDCVTFAGPMSSFSGEPQLNTANFDWLRDYTFTDAP